MKLLLSGYLLVVISIVGCDVSHRNSTDAVEAVVDKDPLAYEIEQAHGKDLLGQYPYIKFDIEKSFGGSTPSTATITASTDGGRIRLEADDGRTIVWNRGELSSTSDSSRLASDRFEVFTWQYFFMLPYKLSDPGVNLLAKPDVVMSDKPYRTVWLAFDDGTGDAADDWYKLHIDPSTGLIRHAGYIVTAGGQSQEEAAANAHSISYNKYTSAAGMPIATQWTFSNYDADNQQVLDSIGYARISNVSFPEEAEVSWEL